MAAVTRAWPRGGHDRRAAPAGACCGCGATQVLLPAALQPRRADSTRRSDHMARKAEGLGYRRIAAALGRSPFTVRRWLRRARDAGHLTQLWQRGAQELIRLDAEAFNELASTGNLLRDTLTVLAAAAWWARRRLGIAEPVWTLIGLYTRGRLSRRPAESLNGPAHPPGPRYHMPGSARHDEHQHPPHAVTVNTITSACTPTTGCSSSPKVTLSYSF